MGKKNTGPSVQRMLATENRKDRRVAEAEALYLADQATVVAVF
jgi:hypothetical protein